MLDFQVFIWKLEIRETWWLCMPFWNFSTLEVVFWFLSYHQKNRPKVQFSRYNHHLKTKLYFFGFLMFSSFRAFEFQITIVKSLWWQVLHCCLCHESCFCEGGSSREEVACHSILTSDWQKSNGDFEFVILQKKFKKIQSTSENRMFALNNQQNFVWL